MTVWLTISLSLSISLSIYRASVWSFWYCEASVQHVFRMWYTRCLLTFSLSLSFTPSDSLTYYCIVIMRLIIWDSIMRTCNWSICPISIRIAHNYPQQHCRLISDRTYSDFIRIYNILCMLQHNDVWCHWTETQRCCAFEAFIQTIYNI